MPDQQIVSPIFIMGMPRSGTTLVRSILSAHSRIIIGPEMNYFRWVHRFAGLNLNDRHSFDQFWNLFVNDNRFAHLNLDADKARQEIQGQAEVDFRVIFTSLLEQYAANAGKPRWGEKTPRNYLDLDLLFQWYPDARVIFVMRDPRATIASLLKTPWGVKPLEDHATEWNETHSVLDKWHGDRRMLVVRYESLVNDPQMRVQGLCKFLEEEYQPEMIKQRDMSIKLDNRNGWAKTALNASTKPVQTESIAKWQDQLTSLEVSLIEQMTRRNMAKFSYELSLPPMGWRGCGRIEYHRLDRMLRRLYPSVKSQVKSLLGKFGLLGIIAKIRINRDMKRQA